MKALLVLRHLNVENANAIAGLTWGFPAISSFLGFSHALSRTLEKEHGLRLGGCAVVCHQHHVCAYQPAGWGDFSFSLTRNPLTREAKSPSFVEEGRMHMEVSLVIECEFTASKLDFDGNDRNEDIQRFQSYVLKKVLAQRLAGGTILGLHRWEPVRFMEVPEESEKLAGFRRKLLRLLLPGFLLVNRADLLANHFEALRKTRPDAELIDAWLDFTALKFAAEGDNKPDGKTSAMLDAKPDDQPDQDSEASEDNESRRKITWQRVPKPGNGWLVPISAGFKAISPLYPNGDVANTRDSSTPFRFVESAYSIGQWISPHRITDLNHLFWRYHAQDDWYLCQNTYRPSEPIEPTEPSATSTVE